MCRFTYYMGANAPMASLLTEPSHSLIHQSFDARERAPLNGDGFGVAWYAPQHHEPAIFKATTPAWNNDNLHDLSRVTYSRCILAHVRAATQGIGVSEFNCHPFKYKQFAFAHNGDIGGFGSIRREIDLLLDDDTYTMIKGTTDSEYLFALCMHYLFAANQGTGAEAMANALQQAIATVIRLVGQYSQDEYSTLNIVLTNGTEAVISRYVNSDEDKALSLYMNQGNTGKSLMISSEPLSDHQHWQAVDVNHMLLIHKDLHVESQAIDIH